MKRTRSEEEEEQELIERLKRTSAEVGGEELADYFTTLLNIREALEEENERMRARAIRADQMIEQADREIERLRRAGGGGDGRQVEKMQRELARMAVGYDAMMQDVERLQDVRTRLVQSIREAIEVHDRLQPMLRDMRQRLR